MAIGRTLPVSESIWLDIKFRKLQRWERYLFIYFLTNNHVEQIGIYEVSYDTIHYETDLEIKDVKRGIESIKKLGLIDYDEDTNEVAILNYLKYSILKGGDPTMKCFMNLGKKIKSTKLMEEVYEKLVNCGDDRIICLFAQLMLKNTLLQRKNETTIELPESINPYVKKDKTERLDENEKKELILGLLNGNENNRNNKNGKKKNSNLTPDERIKENIKGDEELVLWRESKLLHFCYVKSKDIENIDYKTTDIMEPSGEIFYYKEFKEEDLKNIDKRIIDSLC